MKKLERCNHAVYYQRPSMAWCARCGAAKIDGGPWVQPTDTKLHIIADVAAKTVTRWLEWARAHGHLDNAPGIVEDSRNVMERYRLVKGGDDAQG